MTQPSVRAAGGIVWRRGGDGTVQVLVVHRPRYRDWTLPKGKLDDGEDEADAARREVEEETGYRCRIGPEVGTVGYVDRAGRSKSVRYWLMTPTSGAFAPNAEVNEARWLALPEAAGCLTYDRDRRLLIDAEALLPES